MKTQQTKKPKRGRPAKKGPTRQINIRLRPTLYNELTRYSDVTGLSKTMVVELALKRLFGFRQKDTV